MVLTGCSGGSQVTSSFFGADYQNEFFDDISYVPVAGDICDSDTIRFRYEDICFSEYDVPLGDLHFMSYAAVCFDIENTTIIFSQNMFEKVYPASTTKLLTALTALIYGDMDEIYTVTEDRCGVNNYGASVCGLMKGDQISMDELMYCLLFHSGNDAAVAIARCVSGTEADFVELMNKVAAELGCIDTHFANSHGLQHVNHYTTAYDMYLIFNECLKYQYLQDIFKTEEHTAQLLDADGNPKQIVLDVTNQYNSGYIGAPEGITVIGGKTGSTPSAGKCLVLYSVRDYDGHGFITLIFKSETSELLYKEMNDLLKMCLV